MGAAGGCQRSHSFAASLRPSFTVLRAECFSPAQRVELVVQQLGIAWIECRQGQSRLFPIVSIRYRRGEQCRLAVNQSKDEQRAVFAESALRRNVLYVAGSCCHLVPNEL